MPAPSQNNKRKIYFLGFAEIYYLCEYRIDLFFKNISQFKLMIKIGVTYTCKNYWVLNNF